MSGAFEILATDGDTHLGGEDFDQCVVKYFFLNEIKKKHSVARIFMHCEVERAKRSIFTSYQVDRDRVFVRRRRLR